MSTNSPDTQDSDLEWRVELMEQIISCMATYMPEWLAKRVIRFLLLCFNVDKETIRKLTSGSTKAIPSSKVGPRAEKDVELQEIQGDGQKSSFADMEEEIVEELKTGKYHTQQEIADMIAEKYGIRKVSRASLRKLRKKAQS